MFAPSEKTKVKTDGAPTTIAELAKHYMDHKIYYSDIKLTEATGILFDLENDDMNLVPKDDLWSTVEHKKTLESLIYWTASSGDYTGRLMKIMCPKDYLVGYLNLDIEEAYTGARVIDKNTNEFLPIRKAFPAENSPNKLTGKPVN